MLLAFNYHRKVYEASQEFTTVVVLLLFVDSVSLRCRECACYSDTRERPRKSLVENVMNAVKEYIYPTRYITGCLLRNRKDTQRTPKHWHRKLRWKERQANKQPQHSLQRHSQELERQILVLLFVCSFRLIFWEKAKQNSIEVWKKVWTPTKNGEMSEKAGNLDKASPWWENRLNQCMIVAVILWSFHLLSITTYHDGSLFSGASHSL